MASISTRLLVCVAALVCAAASVAQSPLCTIWPFASNGGGSVGGAVFFDLTVNSAVLIRSLDTNYSAAVGLPVGIELWVTPGTHVGNEQNVGLWTRIGVDDGQAVSAGFNGVTSINLQRPALLHVGTWGVALVAVGSGHRYTNGNGTNQRFSNAELTLVAGGAQNAPFTGVVFTPRVWNGCIHYVPGAGTYPDFVGAPRAGASPMTVAFTDLTLTTNPAGIATWAWDFDGDGVVDSTQQNPSFPYLASGTYDVSLTVTDSMFGSRTEVKRGYIVVDWVGADFMASPRVGEAPLTVQFTDLSRGVVTSWAWDFDNDGVVDSRQQNPRWTYPSPGSKDVTLTVANSGNQDTVTKVGFVYVTPAAVDPGPADLVELRFDEPRGSRVANAATSGAAPAHGVVRAPGGPPNETWQGDPGRSFWGANETGFGCLRSDDVFPYESRVETGWPMRIAGSHTISFQLRNVRPASAGYAFGAVSGSARCAYGGASLALQNWGNVSAAIESSTDPGALSGWHHWAVVVDDTAGRAQWYVDGIPDGVAILFPPGTFFLNDGALVVGGFAATTAMLTRHFEMDDFRVYGRALTHGEVVGAARRPNPAATTFGDGCAGPGGVPTIGSTGGVPRLGNASFAVFVGNLEVGAPAALWLGWYVRAGGTRPVDLSFLLGAGCRAETLPDLDAALLGTGGTAQFALPIPVDPSLAGVHAYAQALVLGSVGAVSPALDVGLQR